MSKENDSLEDLKYLLGNMGVEILDAIDKGAKDIETIKIFSGLPISCIKGRIPVLIDLKLIQNENNEFHLAERGHNFKQYLKKNLEKKKTS
ncbi:MAG: hypothetical protein JW891_04500 [Candidatus Lokiarchaeota archaeon]|nr:hypothetical protein [Candidatus Lokiarchaeota archaeon]